MLTLYGMAISPGTRKVRWMLEEGGKPYTFVETDIRTGQNRTPEYLQLNPNGTIPTLDHDGFAVWESNAILTYLGEILVGGALAPRSARDRAAVAQWLSWEATSLHPCLHRAFLVKLWARDGRPEDVEGHAKAVEESKRWLTVLDRHLAKQPFVTGDFGIADIGLGAAVAQADFAQVDLQPWPHVTRWLAGLAERPAFRASHPP